MHRTYRSTWAAILALGLLALLLAGCGEGDTASSSPDPAPSLSAQEMVDQSNAAMADVTSFSFTADVAVTIQGDTTAMEDPMAQALLGNGVTAHMEGATSTDPAAADMDVNLAMGDQVLNLSVLAKGDKAWVGYQDQWYEIDQSEAAAAVTQADEGTTPMEHFKTLGLNPEDWGTEYTYVATETAADGTSVYQVRAAIDPAKLVASLMKAAEDPELGKALGEDAAAAQLKEALEQSKEDAATLQESIKDVAVDYWIGVDDMLMRKARLVATLDTTNQKDADGVDSVSFDMSMTMADFNQPVTVEAPSGAKSMEKLMEQMFGGMLGS